HHGLADNFVLHVQLQLAVFYQIQQECHQIAGVHLTGVIRDAAGQVDGADDRDSVFSHGFSHAGKFAVAATLGGQVNDDGAGGHASYHFGGNQHGGLLAGDDGGGDNHVAVGYHASEQFA